MSEIRVEHLVKSFGPVRVLDDVSFTVKDKEFVTLLGPSGCGKTTTLMSIAGFQTPDAGIITCGDEAFYDSGTRINRPAERRNLGIVFQSYAIWPHMTVAGNVGFPLKIRKMGKRAISERVTEVLDLVEMGEHAGRYPHELSGGQQQRVALARAIACSPGVLLLDEPFSSLDAKLRERARAWLKDLQHSLGVSTVFVTHDQDEALSMSDRIMVMDSGRILRSGTPEEIYREPGSRFVAEFLGQCNFLTGRLARAADGTHRLITPEFPDGIVVRGNEPSAEATIAVRPEDIVVTENPVPHDGPEPAVLDVSYLGDHYQYRFAVGDIQLIALSSRRLGTGAIQLHIPPDVATLVG
ncbi:MAG TPA: ABC transporter ATP-binding protein [Streptosporangiaceae bacterium]